MKTIKILADDLGESATEADLLSFGYILRRVLPDLDVHVEERWRREPATGEQVLTRIEVVADANPLRGAVDEDAVKDRIERAFEGKFGVW